MNGYRQEIERALKWYPRRWRDTHGAALVGMHLDAADDGGSGRRRLSAADAAAIRAAGLFERCRFAVPIGAAVIGTLVLAAGYGVSLFAPSLFGAVLWFVVGPSLLLLSFWGLQAAGAGGWSWRMTTALPLSGGAVAALAGALWIADLRDSIDVARPSMGSLWALGLLFASLVGVVVAITVAPGLVRHGVGREWAAVLAFAIGIVGALPAGLILLNGASAIVAGGVLLWLTIRAARRHRRRQADEGAAPIRTAD